MDPRGLVSSWPTYWRGEAAFDAVDLAAGDAAVDRCRAGVRAGTGGFVFALEFLVVSGRTPPAG